MGGLLILALMGLFTPPSWASPQGGLLPTDQRPPEKEGGSSGLELPPGTTFGKNLPPEDRRLISILWQTLKQDVDDDLKSKLETAKERAKVILHAPEVAEPLKEALSDGFFIELCRNGTLRRIQSAINAGANVNAIRAGWTPLMFAARFNANPAEVVALLVYNGADVNAQASDMTPLIAAVERITDLDVIMALIKGGADVNALSARALFEAARYNNNPEIITALIKNGAYVNAKSAKREYDGLTALMVAAQYNSNPEVITALLKNGADVNPKISGAGRSEPTALRFAASYSISKSNVV